VTLEFVEIALYAATLYVVIGVAFAIAFVLKGAAAIDRNAADTGAGFRLAIFPGCVAFWPLLLARWRRGAPQPVESNAHRDAARAKEPR